MLKIKIKKGGMVRVKTSGTAKELFAATAIAINLVYNCIKKKNPEAATEYKLNLLGVLLDPNNPVWKGMEEIING